MKGIDLISGIGWQYRAGTLVLFLLLLFPLPALAQTTVSTIEGTIKDAQGSVVSGANVKVKSAALGIERDATSDANGFYRVTALPAGNYSLTITHTGFTTRTGPKRSTVLRRMKESTSRISSSVRPEYALANGTSSPSFQMPNV